MEANHLQEKIEAICMFKSHKTFHRSLECFLVPYNKLVNFGFSCSPFFKLQIFNMHTTLKQKLQNIALLEIELEHKN